MRKPEVRRLVRKRKRQVARRRSWDGEQLELDFSEYDRENGLEAWLLGRFPTGKRGLA